MGENAAGDDVRRGGMYVWVGILLGMVWGWGVSMSGNAAGGGMGVGCEYGLECCWGWYGGVSMGGNAAGGGMGCEYGWEYCWEHSDLDHRILHLAHQLCMGL